MNEHLLAIPRGSRLDTEPGSSLYDFGDSIRFGAATAADMEQKWDAMRRVIEEETK